MINLILERNYKSFYCLKAWNLWVLCFLFCPESNWFIAEFWIYFTHHKYHPCWASMDILKQLRYFDHKSFHQIPDLGLTLFSDYVRCAKKDKLWEMYKQNFRKYISCHWRSIKCLFSHIWQASFKSAFFDILSLLQLIYSGCIRREQVLYYTFWWLFCFWMPGWQVSNLW